MILLLYNETLTSSSLLVNSGRPRWRSTRETLKEFLLLCARKSSALRYGCLSCIHISLLDGWKCLLLLIDDFYLIIQKEKAKNFKRQIIKYLESLLQSQQQVSVPLVQHEYLIFPKSNILLVKPVSAHLSIVLILRKAFPTVAVLVLTLVLLQNSFLFIFKGLKVLGYAACLNLLYRFYI